MRILSLVSFLVVLYFSNQKTESPHGSDFKISCKTCHSPEGWQLDKKIYSFNHNKTRLPLIGQHSQINCRQCHTTLVFNEAKSECIQCHKDMHQGSTGSDCSRCHTPASWLVNNINAVHEKSRFPLLGAHRTAECEQCHKSESLLRFDVLGVDCIDCHRENYLATTNPNHVQSGMSENCSQCHPINAFQWSGAGFNHNVFPLVQGHSSVKCTDCHKTKGYTNEKPDCYSCHQQDYLATTNPNHLTGGFAKTCQTCHSLNAGWKPANFNHTTFPLTLGHSTPACADCHKGNYVTTSKDCYSCHLTDYNNSTNPNHKALAFATICTNCHTTNPGWKPATYTQHDSQSFPIYSGKHQGKWTVCTDCHTNTANYTIFTCITCHHKAEMDSKHSGRSGYSYDSPACFRCHPRGSS